MRKVHFVAAIATVLTACDARPTRSPGSPPQVGAESPARVTPGADPGWRLEALPSPANSSSVGPQLTVEGERAILSWLEVDGSHSTLKFADRTAAGWSAPQVVASGDDFVVNASDVPSVRALADGTLVAHWLQSDGSDPEAYTLPLSWSRDGGRVWSKTTTPHHDGKMVQHGFGSLFQAPGAGLGLVWLDGRAVDPHASEPSSGSMALWAAVYGRDGKQISETAVDPRVCDCCPISAAVTSDGVVVAYRDRSADEVRDISVTRFEGGQWSAPTAVHSDGWRIEGCPVNGPAVSARGREVAIAWFTAANDEGRSLAAFSSDGGRTFGQPVRVDDAGSLGEVDIEVLVDGSAAVSWIESGAERSQSKFRRIESNGARSPAVAIADMSRGRAPRLALRGNELLVAWPEIDNGAAVIRTSRISLGAVPAKSATTTSR